MTRRDESWMFVQSTHGARRGQFGDGLLDVGVGHQFRSADSSASPLNIPPRR